MPRQSVPSVQVFDGLLFCVCGSSMKSDSDARRYRCPKGGTGIEASDLDVIFEEELAHFLETRWEAFADMLAGNGGQAASRERFILGGGVMEQTHLFPLVRQKLHASLNGYLDHPSLSLESMDAYVVPPALGNQAGILGAFALAQAAVLALREPLTLTGD